jgi:hypothetical protein
MNTGDHLAKDSEELFNDLSDSEDETGNQDFADNRLLKPTYSSLNKVHNNFKKLFFIFSLIKTRQNGQLFISDKATAPRSSISSTRASTTLPEFHSNRSDGDN